MSKPEHPRYTEIKTAMLVHVPFFSSLLFDMMDVQVGKFPDIFNGRPPTAATDGKRIFIDEDFLSKLKLPECVGLVCHEIGHAMWMHMARAKHYADMGLQGEPFDARRWNHAGDYVINDMLTKSGLRLPDGGLLDKKYTCDMMVEDVYADLKDKMPPPPPNGGDGCIDVHIHAPAEINEAEMKRAVQTALDAAKAMGKCPAALERFATNFVKPVVSWQERLRYHVNRAIARDGMTWNKPHRRRLVTQKLYLPSYTGYGAGEVVVAVDTSGSIGETELNRFFSELEEILQTCRPEAVYLLGCDAAINSEHQLYDGDSLIGRKLEMGGGGGTDFKPVFAWVEEKGIEPSALIYFTDMYGSFPKDEPTYPTIWCKTTKDTKAPWGEEIFVDIEVKDEDDE